MKTKLLKKLRKQGRNQITILSVKSDGSLNVGMSISYDDKEYKGLFDFGDTEEEVLKKAEKIYLKKEITNIRKKYSKYSKRKN